MTFSNNMDRDKAPRSVGPDLRSRRDDLNSDDIQTLSILQIVQELF